jgi:hypothetical protein
MASTPAGYHLSGMDVSGFRGQRVQMVGTLVQPTSPASATGTASSSTPGAPTVPTLPEFRVQSVAPTSGNCPPR